MFSDTVLYGAAHVAYCSIFSSEAEERGAKFPGGENVCDHIPPLTPTEHDKIIRPILARIDEALGAPLADIFTAAGIVMEAEQEDALGDLLLGVQGHGVSIEDDYADAWERGCQGCGVTGELPHDEMDDYRDVAMEKLTAAGYPFVAEGEEPAAEPIIETAFSWHGGQDTAMYAFASTREVQSEDHKSRLLSEIARDIAWHDSHAEQSPGDVNKLKRLETAVKAAPPGTKFFHT